VSTSGLCYLFVQTPAPLFQLALYLFLCDAKHEMIQYVSNNHEVSLEVQHEVQLHTLITVLVQKGKHVFSFSFTYSVLLFSFLLYSGVWLLNATKNVDDCAINVMITLINNPISVFMFVVIS
jgi:hypothetical protein